MKRILMVQPSLQPPGGGNGVGAWMLQALVREHDVSVLTWTPLNLADINRFFGTSLQPGDVRATYTVNPAVRAAFDAIPLPLTLLKTSIVMGECRRVADQYDLIVSANNEQDFGRPGIQYIHYPRGFFPRPDVDLRWYHHAPGMLAAYYALCEWLSPLSLDRIRQNVTLVNSDWVGALVERCHQLGSQTVYPPVTATFPDVPWQEREDAFICIGRIAPEKEIERIIEILERVRRRFPAVKLRIVGTPGLPSYYRMIRAMARARSAWISMHEDLSREQLVDLVPRHRYGIHGMRDEHFGMAPAEMLRAGCIVFVHRSGGQVEIVGKDERLTYDSVEEAADLIAAAIADPARQSHLRAHLADRQELFSTDRFVREIQKLVNAFPS